MRKFIVGLLSLVMIMFMANVGFAGETSAITGGYADYNSYAQDSWYSYSDGEANLGNGYINTNLDETGSTQSAYSGASQTADSESYSVGIFGDTYSASSGEVSQSTSALTEVDTTFGRGEASGYAAGSQGSTAGYTSVEDGYIYSSTEGEAETSGYVSTYVNNGVLSSGDGYYSSSSATTGNYGSANTESCSLYCGGDNDNSYTYGSGSVESGTYTSGSSGGVSGSAGSSGSASFSYNTSDTGNHDSSSVGGGFSTTFGYSEVRDTSDGYHVESHHSSFSSTGGSVDTSVGGNVGGITNTHNVDID